MSKKSTRTEVVRNPSKYHGQEITRQSAIRLRCLDCRGEDGQQVKLCHTYKCPLWGYRMGRGWIAPPLFPHWWENAIRDGNPTENRCKEANQYKDRSKEIAEILEAEKSTRHRYFGSEANSSVALFDLKKYCGQKVTRQSAIRLMCLSCLGNVRKEVEICADQTCPLWPYRMGRKWEEPVRFNKKENLWRAS